jgi:RNA polymerase sigma factor (sigma-70 family)
VTSVEANVITTAFERQRPRLRAIAIRLLGSTHDADDLLQDAWLRTTTTDTRDVRDVERWLTTVVTRLCLNRLRDHARRREDQLVNDTLDEADPESSALVADAVSRALALMMERLSPPERVAFVLHDVFDLDFPTIAEVLDRAPTSARQLASRARRKLARPHGPDHIPTVADRAVVDAFVAASRDGDASRFLQSIHPELSFTSDRAAQALGAPAGDAERETVVRFLFGRVGGSVTAWVDGALGSVWIDEGRTRVVFRFHVADGRVARVELRGEPAFISDSRIMLRVVDLSSRSQ